MVSGAAGLLSFFLLAAKLAELVGQGAQDIAVYQFAPRVGAARFRDGAVDVVALVQDVGGTEAQDEVVLPQEALAHR